MFFSTSWNEFNTRSNYRSFHFLQVNLLKVVRLLDNMVKANCRPPWRQLVWQLLFRNPIFFPPYNFTTKEKQRLTVSLHLFFFFFFKLLLFCQPPRKQIKANIIIFVDCNLIISSCVHCAMPMLCYELSAKFSPHDHFFFLSSLLLWFCLFDFLLFFSL